MGTFVSSATISVWCPSNGPLLCDPPLCEPQSQALLQADASVANNIDDGDTVIPAFGYAQVPANAPSTLVVVYRDMLEEAAWCSS